MLNRILRVSVEPADGVFVFGGILLLLALYLDTYELTGKGAVLALVILGFALIVLAAVWRGRVSIAKANAVERARLDRREREINVWIDENFPHAPSLRRELISDYIHWLDKNLDTSLTIDHLTDYDECKDQMLMIGFSELQINLIHDWFRRK